MQANSVALLTGENLARADVEQPWEQDNQAWWDWYVSLGDERLDGSPRLLRVDPPRTVPELDARQLHAELQQRFVLQPSAIQAFRRDGYVKLKQVFSAGALQALRRRLVAALAAEFPGEKSTSGFLSLEMLWLAEPLVRAFVLSPRLSEICAALLGVERLRLYHDNVLAKQPGCGRTPWHYDDHHFPLATQNVVTAWIPLQPVPAQMGPLAFAADMDAWRAVRDIPFDKYSPRYDTEVAAALAAAGIAIEASPFDLGEVSFHHNLSFHSAAGNRTNQPRLVLANTYFEDGARVVAKPTMVSGDWQKFIPDTAPGEVVRTALNPVCWPADEQR